MRFFSLIGDGQLWFFLCAIFLFIDLFTSISLISGLIIQVILQQLFKRIFIRKRPYEKHEDITKVINPPDRFSFPSGHTAAAFTITFVFYYIYPVLFVPFLIVAIIIGFSRIYLGLHYPSDVLAGIVLGFLSAKLGIFTADKINYLLSLFVW